ncbi:hypothetical protein ACIBO2_40105 [Nonomuraea sp. NPDC050022]|uniref:hypothetical protein n=1 Tax=Nonomuraea sp. NPDC050022 TaxID=3364358 RepID=UPI0037A44208
MTKGVEDQIDLNTLITDLYMTIDDWLGPSPWIGAAPQLSEAESLAPGPARQRDARLTAEMIAPGEADVVTASTPTSHSATRPSYPAKVA